MAENDNYPSNDSLWNRATQYASTLWNSWAKDIHEYEKNLVETEEQVYTYTAHEAKEEIAKIDLDTLQPKEVAHALNHIINHLDTTPKHISKDASTVLYSGGAKIDDLIQNPDYRLIDNTEAFKFLDTIKNELENHPLIPTLTKIHGEKPDFEDWNSPASKFIGGDDSVLPRQQGAWDIISHQFAKEAKGHILTRIGEHTTPQYVFFHTELAAVRESKSVTHLDGFDTQTLFKALDSLESDIAQLRHFKITHYTRNEVAKALDVENPLEVTNAQIETLVQSKTPTGNELREKVEHFKEELLEENHFDTTTHAEKLVDDMAERQGWENTKEHTMGRDIDL